MDTTEHLLTSDYGSRLYGTNTPTSDIDLKVVYLPPFEDVLMGRKLRTYKVRVDEAGNPVPDDDTMPPGGVETEYIPFQTFCRDFLRGQTYAIEVAFANFSNPCPPGWLRELVEKFTTCNVSSMVGFAIKQTFDYVHRGARLEKARRLLALLEHLQHNCGSFTHVPLDKALRLDHTTDGGEKVIHFLARGASLELGTTVNNNKEMETLKLNGRDYLETTAVGHLWTAVKKLVDSYGERSNAAAEAEVDRKSLMHAVRVYQQSLELLETGKMTFPRPNVAELLEIKTVRPLEEVKAQLLELEVLVTEAQAKSSLLPALSDDLERSFDLWLLNQLAQQYKLPFVRFS